mgnify:CR=1 FL=1
MLREHELSFDKVVVGGSLSALKYAFDKQLPIIIYKTKPPHRFSEEFIVGEYGRFCFSLSMAGLIPFSDKIESIRYQEEGPLKITSKNSYLFKVNFNKLIVFNDEGIEGLPESQGKTSELYEVIDWINVRSGMRHEHERLKTTSDFVSCVHFYPTDRLDGHHPDRKDVAAVSYMTEEQLDEFGWSDSYVRLKVLEMMRLAGIKGQSSGTSNYALKIETALREVFPIGKNIYEPTERLEFIYD